MCWRCRRWSRRWRRPVPVVRSQRCTPSCLHPPAAAKGGEPTACRPTEVLLWPHPLQSCPIRRRPCWETFWIGAWTLPVLDTRETVRARERRMEKSPQWRCRWSCRWIALTDRRTAACYQATTPVCVKKTSRSLQPAIANPGHAIFPLPPPPPHPPPAAFAQTATAPATPPFRVSPVQQGPPLWFPHRIHLVFLRKGFAVRSRGKTRQLTAREKQNKRTTQRT